MVQVQQVPLVGLVLLLVEMNKKTNLLNAIYVLIQLVMQSSVCVVISSGMYLNEFQVNGGLGCTKTKFEDSERLEFEVRRGGAFLKAMSITYHLVCRQC